MVDGFNTNRIIRFGDLIPSDREIQQYKESLSGAVSNLFNFNDDFLEKYDNVFSGDTAKNIQKAQSQIHSLGVIMRDGQVERSFNFQM